LDAGGGGRRDSQLSEPGLPPLAFSPHALGSQGWMWREWERPVDELLCDHGCPPLPAVLTISEYALVSVLLS